MLNINHIGWITKDISLFEKFWCDIIGYKEIHSSTIDSEMSKYLFGNETNVLIKRYALTGNTDIEIHCFLDGCKLGLEEQYFDRIGINHVCFHTGEKGSKLKFINKLPKDVKIHTYNNPKGWTNIFIRDYENNWIELRESL